MSNNPSVRINLAVMQPLGYVHSLVFLDVVRYFRHQFRRLGVQATVSKNRLREDALNLVFGAHLGFPQAWQQRNPCVFVNLEQLGADGARIKPDYLDLLRHSAVLDYDAANRAAYAQDEAAVPLISLGYGAYLDWQNVLPLAQRPIDLLFIGSVNARRQLFIDAVEATGTSVTLFDSALYGPERDAYVMQAKAVLNCHYYESNRFEQVRAFHFLSLGTPVISERTAKTRPSAAFEDSVIWLPEREPASYFAQTFKQPAFYDQAQRCLTAFRRPDAAHDPLENYAELLDYAQRSWQQQRQSQPQAVWRPRAIHIGSGKDYRPDWLNLDILKRAQPDLVLDLAQPQNFPLEMATCMGGRVRLEANDVDIIYANNVLEHVPDLPTLMGNALTLLRPGGEFHIEVPYEKAPSAWQDPTHVRALNENSWLYYTDWFWYLGWFDYRFEVADSNWLDAALKPCAQTQAAFMKVVLRKIATTPHERNTARTMRADFGGLDDDASTPLQNIPRPEPGQTQSTATEKGTV